MPAANPKEYQAAWRERNREKLRQKQARYYKANRAKCLLAMRHQREKRGAKRQARFVAQDLLNMKWAA